MGQCPALANVLTIALFESDQPHMIVLYLISPTFNDNDHLPKDNVSIANRSWSVVQVQNAVSTKEARPVRELNWYSIYLMYSNSRNGATPSFFHKCATPFPQICFSAVTAVKTPVG